MGAANTETTNNTARAKYGPTITFRTTPKIAAALERLRQETGERSRSRLINEALAKYLLPVAGKREADALAPLVASGAKRIAR